MISLAIFLFIVMDPFGNLVTINSLMSNVPSSMRQKVILRESAIAATILLLAAFFGGSLIALLGLDEHSLSISGGIVLFLIALGMLFPTRKVIDDTLDEPPLIVPIAMPLIAGPSAISMVILFSQQHSHTMVASAVLTASAVSALLLAASPKVYDFLGRRGSVALERLMGMLLIMISVQMILNGIDAYLLAKH